MHADISPHRGNILKLHKGHPIVNKGQHFCPLVRGITFGASQHGRGQEAEPRYEVPAHTRYCFCFKSIKLLSIIKQIRKMSSLLPMLKPATGGGDQAALPPLMES